MAVTLETSRKHAGEGKYKEADLENFILYRIENDMVIIDNIFHELQDYENHLL